MTTPTAATVPDAPPTLALLREARAALGPEWHELAGRIDDALSQACDCAFCTTGVRDGFGHDDGPPPVVRNSQPCLVCDEDHDAEPRLISESAYRILCAADS